MDARTRAGAAAYDPKMGGGPKPGGAGGQTVGTGNAAGAPYSSSFGNVGMSDDASDAASASRGSTASNDRKPADAFKDVGVKVGELKEFATYYVAAKLDAFKVAGRNIGVYAALGIVGLIAGGTIISTAAVLLLVGLALAIGKPFNPDQPWVGAIVVGLIVLGGLAGGIIMFMKKLTNTSRKRVVEKYENRQRDQRINFGEDVRGRRAGDGH